MARAALHDPWLTERMRNDTLLTRHEVTIERAVLAAMRDWLDAARTLVLGGSLTASTPDPDAVQASFVVWREGLEDKIEPAIGDAFGAGFNASLRTADVSVLPYQERHMQTVHDRLRLWPEGAFEDMRPELVQAVTLGESMDDTTKRVAGILDIDAPTRRLRGRITEVDGLLAAEDLTPARRRDLRALRKRLWQEHDTSLGEWQYLARRIARTETQGAVVGGTLAAAQAETALTGEEMYKAWRATSDSRCRRSHRVADGQIVPLDEKFRVGGALLDHPCDPKGPGREIIMCRCALRLHTRPEVDEQLDSVYARGVQPRSARIGPDPAEQVDLADQLVAAEDRGEAVEWPAPQTVLARAALRPPPPPGSAGTFSRIDKPGTLTEEAKLSNPFYKEDHAYGVNCTHVAQAVELRARGYDVRATRLPDDFYAGVNASGRHTHKVQEAVWRTPEGGTVQARTVSTRGGVRATDAMVKQWGDGARGQVIVHWKGGGGHIFNVENRGGKVVYVEGQTTAKDVVNPREYFRRVNGSFVTRTDDLILRDDVDLSEYVVPRATPREAPSPALRFTEATKSVAEQIKDLIMERDRVLKSIPSSSAAARQRRERITEVAAEIQSLTNRLAEMHSQARKGIVPA